MFCRRPWPLLVLVLGPGPACRCSPAWSPEGDRGVIDFHTHVAGGRFDVAEQVFEQAGVRAAVVLTGLPTSRALVARLAEARSVDRPLVVFAGVDWRWVDEPDFGAHAAEDLRRAVALGAGGLKISKGLGLGVRTSDGSLLAVDDARLDPLWRTAGELGIPVAIHTGDPLAFFEPPTPDNERYAELKDHPSWSFYGDDYPSLRELMAARDRMVARHPQTTFVAVHLGGFPEDIQAVAASLRAHHNLWIDLAARIPEIGRKPSAQVRAFFEEFQDRILFGTDLQVTSQRIILGSAGDDERPDVADAVRYYRVHWRYLESDDADFAHATPIQGQWTISGIGLPRSILDKVYRDNALRLLPQLKSARP